MKYDSIKKDFVEETDFEKAKKEALKMFPNKPMTFSSDGTITFEFELKETEKTAFKNKVK